MVQEADAQKFWFRWKVPFPIIYAESQNLNCLDQEQEVSCFRAVLHVPEFCSINLLCRDLHISGSNGMIPMRAGTRAICATTCHRYQGNLLRIVEDLNATF